MRRHRLPTIPKHVVMKIRSGPRGYAVFDRITSKRVTEPMFIEDARDAAAELNGSRVKALTH